MTMPSRIALRGDLLDFIATPAWGDLESRAVRFRPDHWLLIENGLIVGVQPGEQWPDSSWSLHDHRGHLILPGFIDTHVHSAQLDVVASYGAELLDWLKNYTFPAELQQDTLPIAASTAHRFVEALLSSGTTSALVFPTVHTASVDALFAAAQTRAMRLITGKVLMDRNAPEGLRDDVAHAQSQCLDLISRWHGLDRLSYAVTVRFAPTSTPEQLLMAGELLASRPDLYLQTHLGESQAEVGWVAELFPQARSYLDVYAQAGLVGSRSVLAHSIWLDDTDRHQLAQAGAHVAHCPSSNLFLGSGLFDWRAAQACALSVSVGSDVGAGTQLCMVRSLADAYRVQALQGHRLTAWTGLHACTLGAATALHLQHEIGALQAGLMADICVWDWAVGSAAKRRMAVARDLHEKVFAWMNLADDRNLVETWVAGCPQYQRRKY